MSAKNGSNYLEPYTDEQMVYEALQLYAGRRHAFARQLSDPLYLKANGEPATTDEIKFARKCARQADRLVAYAKEKVESPIIQLQ
jgi:hypothetical protein